MRITSAEEAVRVIKSGDRVFVHGGAATPAQLVLSMTARANDVEPFAYLQHLFERLPAATTVEEIEALLPWNVKAVLPAQPISPASAAA